MTARLSELASFSGGSGKIWIGDNGQGDTVSVACSSGALIVESALGTKIQLSIYGHTTVFGQCLF